MKAETEYWKSLGASDWYAHQKATSISILSLHDKKHGTRFTERYSATATSNRLGRGSVICQKCHADNVIGVSGGGTVTRLKNGTVRESSPKQKQLPPFIQPEIRQTLHPICRICINLLREQTNPTHTALLTKEIKRRYTQK